MKNTTATAVRAPLVGPHSRTLVAVAASALLAAQAALAQTPAAPAAPAAPQTPPAQASPSAGTPTAQEVFAKAVAAAGGADLVRSQKSRTTKGTIEMPGQALKGTIVTQSTDPDLLRIETEITGFGRILQGVGTGDKGPLGWSLDPLRGPSLMAAEELARTLRDMAIEYELDPAKGCASAIVDGPATFEGQKCWKVSLDCDGVRATRFYAQDSGHMVGQVSTVKSSLGSFEVTTSFSEFAAFDGRTIPKVTKNSMMGQQQVVTITEATFAPVDASAFLPPPEVLALAKAGSAPPKPVLPSKGAPASPAQKSTPAGAKKASGTNAPGSP